MKFFLCSSPFETADFQRNSNGRLLLKARRILFLLAMLFTGFVCTAETAKAQGEINIRGRDDVKIFDNDSTPSVSDGTFFGVVVLGDGQSRTQTFTIENTDNFWPLALTGDPPVRIGGDHSGDFSVTKVPETLLFGDSLSTTFEITFAPTSGGIRNATVTIPNSDSNEDPYNFAIQATVRLALSYSTGAGGIISGNTYQIPYYNQDGSPVTAVPRAGYHFLKWTDGSTENPRTDRRVKSNVSVMARFLRYTVADGEVTITRLDPEMEGNVRIPATIEGLPVTTIADGAGAGCANLASISISASFSGNGSQAFVGCTSLNICNVDPTSSYLSANLNVLFDADEELVAAPSANGHNGTYTVPGTTTGIRGYAFANRNDLTNITIPEGVLSIGEHAFFGCEGLTNVSIPQSTTSIGDYAFSDCSGLETVSLPAALTNLGEHAFSHCVKLAGITLPAGLTHIAGHVFSHCSSLQAISMPAGLSSIDEHAFSHCSLLATVTIGTGITEIGDYAFSECGHLTGIVIPNGVTRIGGHAFSGCHRFASVVIPAGVTSIGNHAFSECRKLPEMTIPHGVVHLGKSIFSNCRGLTSIDLPETLTSIGSSAFYLCLTLESVVIPEGVTSIPADLFHSCEALENVVIPEGVTSIGKGAFSSCVSLISITIPGGVTSIEESTFENCTMLKSVNIPEGVTSIGKKAFRSSGLEQVIIPEGVTRIDWEVFGFCENLESVTIPSNVTTISAEPSPPPTFFGGQESAAFSGCTSLTTVTIPGNVATIGISAFSGCVNLTTIIFEGDAPEVLAVAFSGISPDATVLYRVGATGFDGSFHGLRTSWFDYTVAVDFFGRNFATISNFDPEATGPLFLPDTIDGAQVSTIGYRALYRCNGLTSINIPNRISSIGSEAFASCGSLVSVAIPASVTDIQSRVFIGSESLVSFLVDAPPPCFSAEGGVLFNKDQTELLAYPSASGAYTIPDGVRNIGDYAFFLCNSLTGITLPDGVTRIGFSAFRDCSTLASISLPGTLTSIEPQAFDGCLSLPAITIPASVTSIGVQAFQSCQSLTNIQLEGNAPTLGANSFTDLPGKAVITALTPNASGFVYGGDFGGIQVTGLDPKADPYKTGVPNLLTYAFFGTSRDPSTVSPAELPQLTVERGNMGFEFTRLPEVSNLTYGVEWGSTLDGEWQEVPDSDPEADGYQFAVPIDGSRKFLRWKVIEN